MPRPLPGFPRRYRVVQPSPQPRGYLSGFVNRSYAYNPSAVCPLWQAFGCANLSRRNQAAGAPLLAVLSQGAALASRMLPEVIRMTLRLRCEISQFGTASEPVRFLLDLVASIAIT